MRYRIQIPTPSRKSRDAAAAAIAQGLISDAESTQGFVQGTADEDQLRELSSSGVTVLVSSEVPVQPARPARGKTTGPYGFAPARTGDGVSVIFDALTAGYYELSLKGLLSQQVRERLKSRGLRILERLADGVWAVELTQTARGIRTDPAVVSIVRQTAAPIRTTVPEGSGSGREIADAASYEAVLHVGVDTAAVAAAFVAAGMEVQSTGYRVVRFLATHEEVERARAVKGVAEVIAAGIPRILNDMVRPLVGIDRQEGGGRPDLTGAGQVVGIADTGIDVDHPDLKSRVTAVALGRPGDFSDPSGHGTHVAGILAGDGTASNGVLAGIAPKAAIFFQSVMDADGGLGGLPSDVGTLFEEAYQAGVRVHNNSWGIFLDTRYAGPSMDVDRFVDAHPDFLPVIAVGNDGSCLPGRNAGPGEVDLPSVSVPATARNALVVGASRSPRTTLGYSGLTFGALWPEAFNASPIADEFVSGDPESLAAFSGRGPTDDMRIKPDVVAPGTDVASTKSAAAPYRNFWGAYPNNPHYAMMGGTSMACPAAAGIVVLIRQYYCDIRNHLPSAALLRATIINGAQPLKGGDATSAPTGDPNYHQGFGRVNLDRSVPTGGDLALAFVDYPSRPEAQFRVAGEVRSYRLDVRQPGAVRLCLAWTDPPGRALQNTLFLMLEDPDGTITTSNTGLPKHIAFPTSLPQGKPGTFDRDPRNNVHVLRWEATEPGQYIVSVSIVDIVSPQGFALVATGPIGSELEFEELD